MLFYKKKILFFQHFVPLQEENDSMFVQQEEASKCISCA